jgi:hypothetical protein
MSPKYKFKLKILKGIKLIWQDVKSSRTTTW